MSDQETGSAESTSKPAADAVARNRRMLLAMFAIAFLTLGGSYVLFYAARDGGVWGTTNQGEFVDPPLTMAGLALQAVIVAVAAAILGGLLAVAIGPLFPMLVAVTASSFALLVLTAVGIGLLASLAGLRHAVAVDPVLAFGGP